MLADGPDAAESAARRPERSGSAAAGGCRGREPPGQPSPRPSLPSLERAWRSPGSARLIVVFLVYLFAFTPLTAARDQQRLTQSLVGQPLTATASSRVGRRRKGRRSRCWRSRPPPPPGGGRGDQCGRPHERPGPHARDGHPRNGGQLGDRGPQGHVRRPLRATRAVRRGDRIRVVDGVGSSTYRVTRVFTVTSGRRDVVTPTTDDGSR